MEANESSTTLLVAFILLIFSINEIRKSILILKKNEVQLLFAAQIALYLLRLLGNNPKKYKEIMDDYKKSMKLYSAYTILGAGFFTVVSLRIIFSSLLSSR